MSKFYDEQSGATLAMDRYYGFLDSGGLAGSFDGYDSRAEVVAAMAAEFYVYDVGTKPEQLGDSGICVLTGREYVNQLLTLGESIDFWGKFV